MVEKPIWLLAIGMTKPFKTKFPVISSFQPICNRQFILDIPGIDAFLVKSVERPPYIRPKERWSREKPDWQLLDEHLAHKKLFVKLHNAIAPSTEQQVQELIDRVEAIPEVKIKFMDPVGTVIGVRVFRSVVVERVDYDLLTYEDSQPTSEIKLTLSYNSEKLVF